MTPDDPLAGVAGLNDFDPGVRASALESLIASCGRSLPPIRDALNLHCHTFYSFNAHGLSPTGVAWLLRSLGLAAGGIVDFDVLDGVDEFLRAADRLRLTVCAGIETRVFVPELAEAEINSPGEPGIAYHMGVGFVRSAARYGEFLAQLKTSAQARNRAIVERVNAHLDPVIVDYDRDVLPLTPAGNPTERHLCRAYADAAAARFPDAGERTSYWASVLAIAPEEIRAQFADDAQFQNILRRVLMKRGGVGYVQPDTNAFPRIDAFNRFVAAEGAIPTVAWLDGDSPGERDPAALLDLHLALGARALNIIPDRNWNIADAPTRTRKVAQLGAIVKAASERGMPIFVGTEMNAPGQPDVDDFNATELEPFAVEFMKGAHVAIAHTVLEQRAGIGYMSHWARRHLGPLSERRDFYAACGAQIVKSRGSILALGALADGTPKDVLFGGSRALNSN